MRRITKIVLFFLFLSALANAQGLRIQQEELLKNIDTYKILDTRDAKKYNKGHIKNALNFPINLSYEHKQLDGKVVAPKKMQKIIRDLGLNINDPIIIYDNGTYFDAARLFWTLEVYGFLNVKLLNSGYAKWLNTKNPIQTIIRPIKKSNYTARVNNKRLATKFTTQIATKNPNVEIVDARTYDSYLGKKSAASRFGHIQSASHIAATHNINYSNNYQVLKNSKELEATYKHLNKNKKVVVYCDIGRVAAMNYFALRELGYDVSNYDASWKEWGNDETLPITNLSK